MSIFPELLSKILSPGKSRSSTAQRVFSAAILLPPIVVILYAGGWALFTLSCVAFCIVNWEMASITGVGPYRRCGLFAAYLLPATLFSSRVLTFGDLSSGALFFCYGVFISALFLMICAVMDRVSGDPLDVSPMAGFEAASLGFCYTGIFGAHLVFLSLFPLFGGGELGPFLGWVLTATIFSDTAAYFGGKIFKGPKLIPTISPNKTVSGGICGLLAAVLGSVLSASIFIPGSSTIMFVLLGVLLGLLTQLGDAFESMVKRALRVKDSSNLIPGHGGLLDRIDGLLFSSLVIHMFYIWNV